MLRDSGESLKVKVLFLAANPARTRWLAIDEEMRRIEQNVRASHYRDGLEFRSAWAVRPDDLLPLFNQHQPQIVHFSGHGSEHGLRFAGEDGASRLVTTPVLQQLFAVCKEHVRVVFLNACSSRVQAQALLETVDCVIGMKEAVHDVAAATFASSFYSAIGFGKSVQTAFDQGIVALRLNGSSEAHIPELLVKEGIDANAVVLISESDVSGKTPSSPGCNEQVWDVPYARNSVFTGREQILADLRQTFHDERTVALSQPQAMSGLGGIGKTQIAVEYAYQHRQDYHAVLWTLADTREALISGYVAMATLLHLLVQEEQDQQVTVRAVKAWLSMHTNWLLVMDNADDLGLVRDFLPVSFTGHILLTTRAHAMGRLGKRVEVDTMSSESGALLLLRRAGILGEADGLELADPVLVVTAREICEELGGLPLALDQAGAYIEEVSCSLAVYLELYRTHRMNLLQERGGFIDDHPAPVATTWLLSFEKVERMNPAAAELLRFCAFVAPDGIPEELITRGADYLGSVLQPMVADPFAFNEALRTVRAYSLLQRDMAEQTLRMHRLVQAVIQDALSSEERTQWMQRAVYAVNASFPAVDDVGQWDTCERWLPHGLVCVGWIEQEHMLLPEAALLLNGIGYYLKVRGRYTEAELLYRRALAINEESLGYEHPTMAMSLNNLGELYRVQGKYSEAESLFLLASALYEKQLGVRHPTTAKSLNNLALLYQSQGKYPEAELLWIRVVDINEKQLEREPREMATSLNNLAGLYHAQGKYAEAEPLFIRALAMREEQLGGEHPDTAQSLNNLAGLYHAQGKYLEAEPLYKRGLAINKEILGEEHPETAEILSNLGMLYREQRKDEEAEPLLIRALEIREEQLGGRHPKVAESLNNQAGLYREQRKDEEAEPLLIRALEINEKALGAWHPSTARSLNNLASLYRAQRKYEKAEPLFVRALTICEHVLGSQHPFSQASLKNLAELYQEQRQCRCFNEPCIFVKRVWGSCILRRLRASGVWLWSLKSFTCMRKRSHCIVELWIFINRR